MSTSTDTALTYTALCVACYLRQPATADADVIAHKRQTGHPCPGDHGIPETLRCQPPCHWEAGQHVRGHARRCRNGVG